MAAGSMDPFTATSKVEGCMNTDVLRTDEEHFHSSAAMMATASTEAFWEDDPEEKIKKQINSLKRNFHSGRQLLIKFLPRDVTEKDVRELMADFPVQSVVLQTGAGSRSASICLEDPEMLEDWDNERVFVLRGQHVPVVLAPTEMMLCVARLPPSFSEPQFAALVHSYGEVRRSFLMLSELTGISKGYGFVEYTTNETAMQVKSLLHGRQINGFSLFCDWLDSSHVLFESLHSKCLYVDRLPPDFRDMGEFRNLFSSFVNPPYCQIALRNGCPQDWGLVEFSAADDAELTYTDVKNVKLCGHSIRVSFYIPGVRAINVYPKLLKETSNKGKGALLPDPPAQAVFQKLQNLAKHNPIFAQNLQNIILSQLQNVPQKPEAAGNGAKPTTDFMNGTASTSLSNLPACPSGTATSLSIQQPHNENSAPPTRHCPSRYKPSPDGNTQPSFTPNQYQQSAAANVPPHNIKNKQFNKNQMNAMKHMNGLNNVYQKPSNFPRAPLLPTPNTGVSPSLREMNPSEDHLASIVPGTITAAAKKILYLTPPPELFSAPQSPVDFQHNLGLIFSNTHNLNALGSFTSVFAAVQQQHQISLLPPTDTTQRLPTSPTKPPPAAWLPPHMSGPLQLHASRQFSTPATSPAVFTGHNELCTPTMQPSVTTVGIKRKYNHILPSPEQSPKGNYIGQHSQGLGGHYADSFFKRNKKH